MKTTTLNGFKFFSLKRFVIVLVFLNYNLGFFLYICCLPSNYKHYVRPLVTLAIVIFTGVFQDSVTINWTNTNSEERKLSGDAGYLTCREVQEQKFDIYGISVSSVCLVFLYRLRKFHFSKPDLFLETCIMSFLYTSSGQAYSSAFLSFWK